MACGSILMCSFELLKLSIGMVRKAVLLWMNPFALGRKLSVIQKNVQVAVCSQSTLMALLKLSLKTYLIMQSLSYFFLKSW